MAVKVSDEEMVQLCNEFAYDVPKMVQALKERRPDIYVRPYRVVDRIKKLRGKGMLPLDSGNFVSSGELLKGSSTLFDEDGNIKLQWVKSDVEKQTFLDNLKELIEDYSTNLPQFEKKPYEVTHTSSDLMAVYPLGDPHIGMKAYKEEAGEYWDLEKSQQVFCGVFDRLVKTTPSCDRAVVVNLGDYFHRDNVAGVTERHKHSLDTSGNYMMMVDTGLKIILQMINSALEHHKFVDVITAIGNHDDTGAMFLKAALKHMYVNEPRVAIDESQSVFSYFKHGKCFFGVHHGHTCKAAKLPLVMATDRPEDWGTTKHRYWLTG